MHGFVMEGHICAGIYMVYKVHNIMLYNYDNMDCTTIKAYHREVHPFPLMLMLSVDVEFDHRCLLKVLQSLGK